MAAPNEYLLHRLKAWGCGFRDVEGLTPAEQHAIHQFKEKVAELGAELYLKMPPAKADALLVKAVFSMIRSQLKSLET
jgi:hypothetical protein